MGFYDAIRVGASGAASAYEVERSLRFNDGDSPWLERTVSSSSNRKTFTISAWVKRSSFGFFNIFGQTDTSGSNMFYMTFDSSHQLYIIDYAYPTNNYHFITNRKFRDTSAWYHIVLAVDTTQATNTNRSKLYVNGVQETSFSTANYPSQNLDTWVNHTTYPVRIGRFGWGHTTYFDGYMAEYNFIDGQALTPSSFAETDATTGQWNPIDTSGLTFGTNGFYLKFSDNSGTTATTLGKDSSGNGNNFTPNNFSVAAGADNDSVEDTPTNNFPTLNPLMAFLNGSSSNAENGNLRWNGVNQNQAGCPASMAFPTSGKWYWEVRLIGSNSNFELGITPATWSQNQNPLSQTGAIGYAAYGSKIVSGTETSSWAASFTSSDVVGVLLDMDNNDIEFYKNNSSVGTISLVSGYENVEYLAIIKGATNAATISSTINFGQQGFSYTPPTGYKALCSNNLPVPSIKLPNKHFDTVLYTGTGSSQNITGLEFQPDLFWAKVRNQAYHHTIMDSVRGTNKQIWSNRTNAEQTDTSFLTSFNSDGVTLGDNSSGSGATNTNGDTYVAWNWNAGGSTVTNNDGSVSAQVRASTTAGISIISWTGTGSNLTIGHGLGVAPKVYIVKARTGSSGCDWFVYHKDIAATHNLRLNNNSASGAASDLFNNTEPTSSVLSIGDSSCINENNGTYVTYAFSEVAGYSKINFWKGNSSTNGPFVYCGFRPAVLLHKRSSDTGPWHIFDNKRNTYNSVNKTLYPSSSEAEYTNTGSDPQVDFLSNGFKVRSSYSAFNGNNDTLIWIAFAESPFKYARAR